MSRADCAIETAECCVQHHCKCLLGLILLTVFLVDTVSARADRYFIGTVKSRSSFNGTIIVSGKEIDEYGKEQEPDDRLREFTVTHKTYVGVRGHEGRWWYSRNFKVGRIQIPSVVRVRLNSSAEIMEIRVISMDDLEALDMLRAEIVESIRSRDEARKEFYASVEARQKVEARRRMIRDMAKLRKGQTLAKWFHRRKVTDAEKEAGEYILYVESGSVPDGSDGLDLTAVIRKIEGLPPQSELRVNSLSEMSPKRANYYWNRYTHRSIEEYTTRKQFDSNTPAYGEQAFRVYQGDLVGGGISGRAHFFDIFGTGTDFAAAFITPEAIANGRLTLRYGNSTLNLRLVKLGESYTGQRPKSRPAVAIKKFLQAAVPELARRNSAKADGFFARVWEGGSSWARNRLLKQAIYTYLPELSDDEVDIIQEAISLYLDSTTQTPEETAVDAIIFFIRRESPELAQSFEIAGMLKEFTRELPQ